MDATPIILRKKMAEATGILENQPSLVMMIRVTKCQEEYDHEMSGVSNH